jgi:hypothetical protein
MRDGNARQDGPLTGASHLPDLLEKRMHLWYWRFD